MKANLATLAALRGPSGGIEDAALMPKLADVGRAATKDELKVICLILRATTESVFAATATMQGGPACLATVLRTLHRLLKLVSISFAKVTSFKAAVLVLAIMARVPVEVEPDAACVQTVKGLLEEERCRAAAQTLLDK